MTKILVVESGPTQVLKEDLEAEGFEVRVVHPTDVVSIAADEKPDLILSGVVMEGMDGFTLCRELKWDRRTTNIPIILISGRRLAEEDQLKGLEFGADDYLIKPVSSKLLIRKIKTVLRRYSAPDELEDVLSLEDLRLDVKAWTVTIQDQVVLLTRKEFDLLLTFLQQRGRVLRPSYLLEAVWGIDPEEYEDYRTVKVHISSLRKKLGERLGGKIVNVPGVGYRLDA